MLAKASSTLVDATTAKEKYNVWVIKGQPHFIRTLEGTNKKNLESAKFRFNQSLKNRE